MKKGTNSYLHSPFDACPHLTLSANDAAALPVVVPPIAACPPPIHCQCRRLSGPVVTPLLTCALSLRIT